MNTYPLSRAKLLAHLNGLGTGFEKCGHTKLSELMGEIITWVKLDETTSRDRLLVYLGGLDELQDGRLSSEILMLIEELQRGEFDDLTGNNNSGLNYERP